jgi:hypothetical protein
MQWGLALQNLKAPAVPQVLYGCVVDRKTPMRSCSDVQVLNCPFPCSYAVFWIIMDVF